MFYNGRIPQRSRPARGVIEVGQRPTLVFVTVRASTGSRSLAETRAHSIIKEVWFKADYWEIGTYVLMPDHLHFLAWPSRIEFDLDRWIQYWKSLATKKLGKLSMGGKDVRFITQSALTKAPKRKPPTPCKIQFDVDWLRTKRIGPSKARFLAAKGGEDDGEPQNGR